MATREQRLESTGALPAPASSPTVASASAPTVTPAIASALAQHRAETGAQLGELLHRPAAELTPARVFAGHVDGSYRTATLLSLQAAQAVARRAVKAPLDLEQESFASLRERYGLYDVCSAADTVDVHVANPTLGRQLSEAARAAIELLSSPRQPEPRIQFVIGDGLSATAVHAQVPALLPALIESARQRGWSVPRPFAVRHCRVGVVGDIGVVTGAEVVVLLIGERPGLATAESLSAYLQFRPRPGETDANRNVISNIHAGGLTTKLACARITQLIAAILDARTSGVAIAPSALADGSQLPG